MGGGRESPTECGRERAVVREKCSGSGLHRTLDTRRDLDRQTALGVNGAHKWHLKWVVCSRKKNTEGEESSGQDLRGHQNRRGAQCETWQGGLRTNTPSGENREQTKRGEPSRRDTHGCGQKRKGLSDESKRVEKGWGGSVGRESQLRLDRKRLTSSFETSRKRMK